MFATDRPTAHRTAGVRQSVGGRLVQALALVAPAAITSAGLKRRGIALTLSPQRINYAPVVGMVAVEELLFRRATLTTHPALGVASDVLDIVAHRSTTAKQVLILATLFTYFRGLHHRYGFLTATLAHAGYDLVVLATVAAKAAPAQAPAADPDTNTNPDTEGAL